MAAISGSAWSPGAERTAAVDQVLPVSPRTDNATIAINTTRRDIPPPPTDGLRPRRFYGRRTVTTRSSRDAGRGPGVRVTGARLSQECRDRYGPKGGMLRSTG